LVVNTIRDARQTEGITKEIPANQVFDFFLFAGAVVQNRGTFAPNRLNKKRKGGMNPAPTFYPLRTLWPLSSL